MRNPISSRKRRRYRVSRVPTKTKILQMLASYIGSDILINDSKKVRASLIEIANDEKLWELLGTFGKDVKSLAKYGIEQGY